MAILQQIWLYEIIGGTLPMCQNTTMRVNGARIKRYCVLCSKTYSTLHSFHNFPAGSRQTSRGARICETSLYSGCRYSRVSIVKYPQWTYSELWGFFSWWRHQMETFSVVLAICAGNSPVAGEFPTLRPVTRSFGAFFDLCVNKRLSK